MAPKHHPTPLSGGDRKALNKELGRARAMTTVLARRSQELRAEAEILIKQAGKLLWESWNERNVGRWRTYRSFSNDRPGPQRRLSLAPDSMFAMQSYARCRTREPVSRFDHVCARSRQPTSLPKVRQGGTSPIGNT